MAAIVRTVFDRLAGFRSAIPYLTAYAVISALCMLVYLETQQSLRFNANDPQIQMAEDAAAAMADGRLPALGSEQIEISQSLSPYTIVFDNNGHVVTSNAVLDGRTPSLPPGVFEWVKLHGEDRITWQPRAGVRSALVVTAGHGPNGGFVAAGRSMREVEQRIAYAGQAAAAVWILLLIGSTLAILFYRRLGRSITSPADGHLRPSR
ncbi:MAG TPA: hypothetical protein VGL38_11485 [bacterium]|jgi:hypothetical protein